MTKLGIHFPQGAMPADFGAIRDFVQRAEDLGYHHMNVPDHVLQTRTPRADFPRAAMYTTEYPHHEALTILAFAAGITKTLRLKTAILILPQRQAALVAKQAAQLDVVSNGRLELGVGLGWNAPEYTALNENFGNRAVRMEEQIEVCRLLWTEQHVDYQGRWHTIEDAGVAPLPVQQPIPVWIGAFVPPAIARAARIADGWQAMLAKPDEQAAAVFNKFREDVQAAGRDPQAVEIEATVFATGSDPAPWVEEARAWFGIGANRVIFRPQGSYEEIVAATERFGGLLNEI